MSFFTFLLFFAGAILFQVGTDILAGKLLENMGLDVTPKPAGQNSLSVIAGRFLIQMGFYAVGAIIIGLGFLFFY